MTLINTIRSANMHFTRARASCLTLIVCVLSCFCSVSRPCSADGRSVGCYRDISWSYMYSLAFSIYIYIYIYILILKDGRFQGCPMVGKCKLLLFYRKCKIIK